MKFTLNRNKTVTSLCGRSVQFIEDEPTHVPPDMYEEVRAIGAVEVDEGDKKDAKPGEPEEKVLSSEERKSAIWAAFDKMVKNNNREDFTGTGTPHTKPLVDIVNFRVDNKERDAMWKAYKLKDQPE